MDNMLTLSALKERGWTQKMIDTLLPAPILKQNPMYKNAAPMKLWYIVDVEQAEKTDEYAVALEHANKRKASSEKAVKTKAKNTEQAMLNAADHIHIEVLSMEELENRTLESKQDWYNDHGDYESDAQFAPQETVNRWMVNYIRHNLTSYDDVLDLSKGKVGKNYFYPVFKNIVLQKIASAYPELKDECARQKLFSDERF